MKSCTSFYLADDRLTIDIGQHLVYKAYHGFHMVFFQAPCGDGGYAYPYATGYERAFVIKGTAFLFRVI